METGKMTMLEQTILDTYFLETSDQMRAISETTRWRMLNLLIAKPMTGSQLARILNISRPRAHYHLKILEKVGLIEFLEERQFNHMIERYYRAIARSFRTDNLLAKAGNSAETDEDSRQTHAALHDIIHSMLALVDMDISSALVQPLLIKMNYSYQEDVHLTREQFRSIKGELQTVVQHCREFESQNRYGGVKEELLPFRYTLILTPAVSVDEVGGEDQDI